MGIKRGYRYKDENKIPCSICGELIHPSGMKGHERKHGLHDGLVGAVGTSARELDESPATVATGPPSASNKQLREEVERVRLTGELARYGAAPQPTSPAMDVAAQLALENKAIEQIRQGSQPSGALAQLKEIGEISAAIRSIAGTDQNKGNSGLFDTAVKFLALVGITGPDLGKFLFQRNTPGVISDGHFKIGDMTVPSGVMITPGLYEKMIAEQGAVERSKVEAASKVKMAETADRVFGYLAPLIADKFGTPTTTARATTKSPATETETPTPGGAGEAIEAEVEAESIFETICPSCGRVGNVAITASSVKKSQEFMFSCPTCQFQDSWIYEPGRRGELPYVGAKYPESVLSVQCPLCKARGRDTTIVASSLAPVGATVHCPEASCSHEFTVEEREEVPETKKGGRRSSSRLKELRQNVEERRLEVELEQLGSSETPVNEDEGGR